MLGNSVRKRQSMRECCEETLKAQIFPKIFFEILEIKDEKCDSSAYLINLKCVLCKNRSTRRVMLTLISISRLKWTEDFERNPIKKIQCVEINVRVKSERSQREYEQKVGRRSLGAAEQMRLVGRRIEMFRSRCGKAK